MFPSLLLLAALSTSADDTKIVVQNARNQPFADANVELATTQSFGKSVLVAGVTFDDGTFSTDRLVESGKPVSMVVFVRAYHVNKYGAIIYSRIKKITWKDGDWTENPVTIKLAPNIRTNVTPVRAPAETTVGGSWNWDPVLGGYVWMQQVRVQAAQPVAIARPTYYQVDVCQPVYCYPQQCPQPTLYESMLNYFGF